MFGIKSGNSDFTSLALGLISIYPIASDRTAGASNYVLWDMQKSCRDLVSVNDFTRLCIYQTRFVG